MSLIVDRTCTEIEIDGDGRVRPGESKPLGEFRSVSTLVLLGDPGAGKTTTFETECEAIRASGQKAEYRKARDFVTLHVDSYPEWRDSVLFIDGLDEIRAGSVDSRTPFDEVRGRLDELRPPAFRISCREADWLGNNDRQRLAVVSPDSTVTVVRLDPLNTEAIREVVAARFPDLRMEDFVENARSSGIWQLLENPLTLQLMGEAISQGRGWPDSRREMFEMACEKLVTEQNSEHLQAGGSESPTVTLDAAGYLCAMQLVAGLEGYVMQRGLHLPSFSSLDDLDQGTAPLSRHHWTRALGTRLFTAENETGFVPVHRQLAEFLGGRFLARLVRNGLPARRVTALMTGPSDGRVVTPLRGLSAWLAAYSDEARSLLIDADPVGVGLYGDISGFSGHEKKRLLESLAVFATQGSLGYGDEPAWAFRSLVSAETLPAVRHLLQHNDDEAPSRRILEFVLRVVSNARDADLESLACLAPDLEAILWDAARPSETREAAVEAYIRVSPPGDTRTLTLRAVLDAVHDRTLPDPDDQIAGTLLRHLYPDDLPPAEVWRYAAPRNSHVDMRQFWEFWDRTLLTESSGEQIADLLDTLYQNSSEIVQMLQDSGFEDLPGRLLARGLQTMGDRVDLSRLYRWLTATVPPIGWGHASDDHVHRVREWLEARPRLQKEVLLRWLKLSDSPDCFTIYRSHLGDVLHGSRLSADFGMWCLDQAILVAVTDQGLSKKLLKESYCSVRDPTISRGLNYQLIHSRLSGLAVLEEHYERLHDVRPSQVSSTHREYRQRMEELREQQTEVTQRRRDDWILNLRSQEAELLANTFPPQNLHYLALVYLSERTGGAYAQGQDRIEDLVGGDPELANSVMVALRCALWRDDLPDVTMTISLHSQKQMPYVVHPVLASMGLSTHEAEPVREMDTDRMRRALAIYYCHVSYRDHDARTCYDKWFQENPNLVLDVLFRCAGAAVRNGDEVLPGVYELDRMIGHEELVFETRLRLLDAFPTRIPSKQLRLFDSLLGSTLRQVDNTLLKPLAEKKLTMRSLSVAHRVRWMTVNALVSGGQPTHEFRTYVGASERRIRHLAEFLHNTSVHTTWETVLWGSSDSQLLANLVEMLGRSYSPQKLDGFFTLEIGTSQLIEGLIRQLSVATYPDAHEGLARLVGDPHLGPWNRQLTWAQEKQRIAYRDASYSHPSVTEVQDALDNRAPANAADLAALLGVRLHDIGEHVRGGNTNPWRQFWNEDSNRRPTEGRPEDSCRDVLLEALNQRLPRGVDLVPEGRYAAEKRADIRASFDGFNVPIEIKKNSHRDLWSALRRQLINQYTTDPATAGYGIYLVLWFGAGRTTRHPDGRRPDTPGDLARQLQGELTTDEARKISVIVMDVTRPG